MFRKFVKAVFLKSGLEEQHFACKGSKLFITPIGDFYKGFDFSRVGDHFYIWCSISPIYEPTESMSATYSFRIKPKGSRLDFFMWDDKLDRDQLAGEIVERLYEHLPVLQAVNSPMDFFRLYGDILLTHKDISTVHHYTTMAYTLVYADNPLGTKYIELAKMEIADCKAMGIVWIHIVEDLINRLEEVVRNPSLREARFHSWKLETLRAIRLERFSNLSYL